MKIKVVTITGADEFVNPADLIKIENRFPFVEWGILFSESKVGTERYPGREWMESFISLYPKKLSAHICGKYMRDILSGNLSLFNEEKHLFSYFKRAQLNFNVKNSDINIKTFMYFLQQALLETRINEMIFQVNKSNTDFINQALIPYSHKSSCFSYLFDASGGRGVLREWSEPLKGQYCGYAGGLSAENLEEQLAKIEEKVGDGEIWIDVESGVRTDNKLDLHKVCAFLKIAEKYV